MGSSRRFANSEAFKGADRCAQAGKPEASSVLFGREPRAGPTRAHPCPQPGRQWLSRRAASRSAGNWRSGRTLRCCIFVLEAASAESWLMRSATRTSSPPAGASGYPQAAASLASCISREALQGTCSNRRWSANGGFDAGRVAAGVATAPSLPPDKKVSRRPERALLARWRRPSIPLLFESLAPRLRRPSFR